MGNALCLSGRGESKPQEQYATAARVSPIPSVRKRRRPSDADSGPPPLQALCVAAVARRADALDISVLPTELIQRVADYLVDEGHLDLCLLPHVLTRWTDSLALSRLDGVCDAWMERVAVCHGLRVLDITNCNMVTSAGLAALRHLRGLVVLRASNCQQIGDEGLDIIAAFTRLQELRLDGCEQISDLGARRLSGLVNLKALGLGKCARLGPPALAQLAGLTNLTELDLGWCRGVGLLPPCGGAAAGGGGGGAGGGGGGAALAAAAAAAARGGAAAVAAAAALPGAVRGAAAVAAGGGGGGGGGAGAWQQTPAWSAAGTRHASVADAAAAGAGLPYPLAPGAGAAPPPPSYAGPLAPLAGLTNLSVLNLCGVRVTDDDLAPLGALTGLTSLDLSGNPKVTIRGLAAAILPRPAAAAPAGDEDAAAAAAAATVAVAGPSRSSPPPPPPGCARLSRLRLRDCGAGDGGRGFGELAAALAPRLRSLDLSCTRVGSRGLLQLAPLTGLTELLLDMCSVTDNGCQVFSALTNLEHLDLSDTEVGNAGAFHLARLRKLRRLGLCDTDVGDGAVAALTGLTALTALNLDARHVSDEALHLLRPLAPHLMELDLYGCKVTLRGASALPSYTQLTHLVLCGGWLTDRAAAEVAKLPRLQHLSIAQNPRLSDAAAAALAAGACAPTLEALNLTSTSIGDRCLPLLARMPALSVVALSNTRVTRAGADHLRRTTKLLVKYAPPHGGGS